MAFADTHHYKKAGLFTHKKETYWSISPFGDGNCGLYAFACGLIDSILTAKLPIIEEEKFAAFKDVVGAFLKLESKNISTFKDELKSEVDKLKELIYQPDLDFHKFKDFLEKFLIKHEYSLNRKRLAASNLILGQGLRTIGDANYVADCKGRMGIKDLSNREKQLSKTGKYVGDDILVSLANYFDIHIRLIVHLAGSKYYDASLLPEGSTPTFALLLKNKHWHYLIPSQQKLGLAAILPFANSQRRIARQLSHSKVKIDNQKLLALEDKKNQPEKTRRSSRDLLRLNEKLIQEVETIYTQKQTGFTAAVTTLKRLFNKSKELFGSLRQIFNEESEITILKRLSNNFKKIFDNFKKIFNQESKQTPAFKDAVEQAKLAAKKSTQTINLWREEWAVSNNQDEDEWDRNLNELGLHLEVEKELIKKPLATDKSDDPAIEADAAVAAIMQNADIADFLSRNYTILKKRTSSLSTHNCSADIRDHNQSVTAHDLRNVDLCISV